MSRLSSSSGLEQSCWLGVCAVARHGAACGCGFLRQDRLAGACSRGFGKCSRPAPAPSSCDRCTARHVCASCSACSMAPATGVCRPATRQGAKGQQQQDHAACAASRSQGLPGFAIPLAGVPLACCCGRRCCCCRCTCFAVLPLGADPGPAATTAPHPPGLSPSSCSPPPRCPCWT